MSNKLVKGTLILSIATLLSKILGSAFRIPLQNIAGDSVLGIFTLVYPFYMVGLILSVAGIPIAISKLISDARTSNDHIKVSNIFKTARILAMLFGIISFTLFFSFSDYIAFLLGGKETKLSILIVSITLLIAPYMAVYRGFFQGLEDMRPTAVSQVLEQLSRVILILFIAYFMVQLGYNSSQISGGIMIASIIGAIISLVYLRRLFVNSKDRPFSYKLTKQTFFFTSKSILTISIPIAFGAISMALFNLADSLSVPLSLRNLNFTSLEITQAYGIYGRGLSLVQITTIFASSIILPLIPLIGKHVANAELETVKSTVEKSLSLTHLLSWPGAIGLFSLAIPINLTLFSDLQGTAVLAVVGISSIFTSLTVLGIGILQGLGEEKKAAYVVLIAFVMKIMINIVIIKYLGILGAAISTLIIYFISYCINSFIIHKKIGIAYIKKQTIVSFISSIIMGILIGLPTLFIDFVEFGRFLSFIYTSISILFGGTIYLGLLIIFKGLTIKELMELLGRKSLLREK
ncbi:putative polysaccharide biosynthesis protein [Bacillus pinisoli]|uniref:putative polysaccharide biosynthesis protein n=1 Tax=Bacillus pinisoli TaxID=2901866 RepID=UPI001FF48F4E|nr:polysaccharide biosynthesis protein [Bacillus pinisoli]